MIIETDYSHKSGLGTAMFSRRGISTIQNYMCFSIKSDQPIEPGMPIKKKTECNPERLTRGITRDDFKRLQIADAREGLDDEEGFFAEELIVGKQATDSALQAANAKKSKHQQQKEREKEKEKENRLLSKDDALKQLIH